MEGSLRTTSRRCFPSLRDALQAASTASCAFTFPIFFARAIETISANIKPRVASRFASIRSASTSNRGTSAAIVCAAPPASETISGSVSHSACQPPSPRSCSCGIAASIVPTSPGTRVAAESTAAHATGFRLCGIVEEPPRPFSAGSKTSATSVCDKSEMSFAIFPSVPTSNPRVVSNLGDAIAMRMPGNFGERQFQLLSEMLGDFIALFIQRRERSDGASELQHQAARLGFAQPLAMPIDRVEPPGNLRAECRRQRVLHPCAPDHYGRAMFGRKLGEFFRKCFNVGRDASQRTAQLQNEPGVDNVLARRSPMHIAGSFRVIFRDERGQRFDDRNGDVAGRFRTARQCIEIEERRFTLLRNRLNRGFRNDSGLRLRLRQRRLEAEHRLKARPVRKPLFNFFAAKQSVEQIHLGSLTSDSLQTFSIMSAMPWPTPMHIVQSAYLPLVRMSW